MKIVCADECCYLTHFETPYKHTHYLEVCATVNFPCAASPQRDRANLLRVVNDAGIRWVVVRVWPGGNRTLERQLKGHSSTRYCPVCNGTAHVCWDCGKVYRYPGWLRRHTCNGGKHELGRIAS
jgi:hypothetical protein